ncbi:MAG: hypothetical protein Q8P41_17030 [Pseudomonadota bacterium]|nr:hypothetical protein [Pseudomonadota bacterium]
MRSLLLLPILLAGCDIGGHDGTYLMTLQLKSDSCAPESPAIGQESQAWASIYRTGQSVVFEVEGALLVGTGTGNEFEVGYEQGSETSYDGCDRLSTMESLKIEGTFGNDLGFEGEANSLSRTTSVSCPDDDEQSCERKYDITAMKIDAAKDRRPTGSIAWGYSSGGGY